MYVYLHVCVCMCVYIYVFLYCVCVCVCMNVCLYIRMFVCMCVYSMYICIYSGKEGSVRYPSLGDALAAILQGRDELYLLAQKTDCDLSPYWCSELRSVYSHLCVFSRNQSFYRQADLLQPCSYYYICCSSVHCV